MSEDTSAVALFAQGLRDAKAKMAGRVKKAGRNQHGGYSYAGHEQVIEACRAALVECGINIEAPAAMEGPKVVEVPRGDKRIHVWVWRVDIPVSHVGGHRETYQVIATTQANDKAAFVASTAADRTVRLRLCGLAGTDKEDPEHDTHDGMPAHRDARQQPRANPNEAKAAQMVARRIPGPGDPPLPPEILVSETPAWSKGHAGKPITTLPREYLKRVYRKFEADVENGAEGAEERFQWVQYLGELNRWCTHHNVDFRQKLSDLVPPDWPPT